MKATHRADLPVDAAGHAGQYRDGSFTANGDRECPRTADRGGTVRGPVNPCARLETPGGPARRTERVAGAHDARSLRNVVATSTGARDPSEFTLCPKRTTSPAPRRSAELAWGLRSETGTGSLPLGRRLS